MPASPARSPYRDDDPISIYLRQIGSHRILTREEEALHARAYQQHRDHFLEALYAIPWVARRVLAERDRRLEAGTVILRLSEDFASHDEARAQALLQQLGAVQQRLERGESGAKALAACNLSLAFVCQVYAELKASGGSAWACQIA